MAKIRTFLGTGPKDGRIDLIEQGILRYSLSKEHWIGMGVRLSDNERMNIISFGEGTFGDDLDELKSKDLPVLEDFQDSEFVLYGPDVFKRI